MMTENCSVSYLRMIILKKLGAAKAISEIMVPAEPYLLDTATAKDAIVLIEDTPFKMIPVVDKEHKIVGLVTNGSLLSALSSQWIETEEDQNE